MRYSGHFAAGMTSSVGNPSTRDSSESLRIRPIGETDEIGSLIDVRLSNIVLP
ncbi:hypothetical protein PGT21_006998 [Puccinia graminis f. sp. tritici]|uniref:Uncharacterized protein n=1 Tax=Puccinia graminis f. sp. tritici TaxID=56615 RepID=A0A5B0PMC3_PUCGR|nr:hypothetical protein PGT21_006998 [Puccinia graminis f. sp. tritici]